MMDSEPQQSLDTLAALASAGDEEAFYKLLGQTAGFMRFLISKTAFEWDENRRDDLRQELCLKLIKLFKRSPDRLPNTHWGAWLTVVIRRLLQDKAKKQNRQPDEFFLKSGEAEAIDAQTSTPSVKLGKAEEAVRLAAAVEQLTPELRKVAELRIIEQLGVHETAERLGKTAKCVHTATKRAVDQLKALLGQSSATFSSAG